MKKLLPLLIAGLLAMPATHLWAQTIRMGTEGAYPPYNFINDKGEVDGFERELGDEICRVANLDCVWVTNDWDSIIPNLISGNYDTIMAGMSITAERDQVIDFSQAYFPPDPSAYVALAGASEEVISGIVAAQTATIQAAHVGNSEATLVEFAAPDETVAAVRSGEVDSVLADYAFLKEIVDSSNGELAFVGERVMLGGGIGIGVRESDRPLRNQLDNAISQLKANGTLNRIITKWMGAENAIY